MLENLKGKRVLDIGCSYGWFEENVPKDKPSKLCAIDPDEKILAETKKKYPDGEYTAASALNLPFEDNYFDVVMMLDVIEHVPRNTEMIAVKEVQRVLKPGGTFYLSTPKKTILGNLLDPAWYLGHRHYTPVKVSQFLIKNNFEVEWIRFGGGLVSLIYMILYYFTKFLFKTEMKLFSDWFKKHRHAEYEGNDGFVTIFAKGKLKK